MAVIPKRYLYDKTVLALLSVQLFLVITVIINIILRITSGQGVSDYFVEYRSTEGIGAFSPGGVWGILSFVVFVLMTLFISVILSLRTFVIKRQLCITILSFGVLLCLIAGIVSNALLALR